MKKTNLPGFTLIETSTALGVLAILFGIVMVNLLGGRERAIKTTSVDTFISDSRSQQLKSMLGDTQGRSSPDAYGIYFSSNSYTLFHGLSYSPADPANFTINLGDNTEFENVLFPSGQIIFASGSGEIVNFINNQNSLEILNTVSDERRTLRFNRFGVITYDQ